MRFGREGNSRRSGLTLIELLAAIVLLSVLMTALVGLVPRFSRTSDTAETGLMSDRRWARLALERIAEDLVNSKDALLTSDALLLKGRVARDPATGLPKDAESTCHYQFVRFGNREMLMREQSGRKDLLGCGAIYLEIESDNSSETTMIRLPDRQVIAEKRPLSLSEQLRLTMQTSVGESIGSVVVICEALPASATSMETEK